MKFEYPYLLIFAAAVIPAGVALYMWMHRLRRRLLDAVVAPRLREQLTRSVNPGKRKVKATLFALGLVALLVALARPQLGFRFKEIERTSIDFIIAFDLSSSMLAEDGGEGKSRLDSSKKAVADFIDNLGEDRVGLIGFAGESFEAAPVTQDHEAVKRNLAALDTKSIAKQGTNLASAIQLAEKTFATGDFESKALVIVTDGEELEGDAVIGARAAAEKGMKIFTVGVGTTKGARIPQKEPGSAPLRFAKNEFGREVLTRLNERVMQQIAVNGHGIYEPLGLHGEGLRTVYENGLAPLGRGTRLKPSKDPLEHFQWPLGLAICLLLIECLLSERRSLKPAKA